MLSRSKPVQHFLGCTDPVVVPIPGPMEGPLRSILRASVLLAVCLLSCEFLLAQCQIVRADWGAGHRRQDVTSRVASMAQGGQLNFKVNNTNLGGDPAVGLAKTLRIVCRDWRGKNDNYHYREGDYVSLQVVGGDYYPGGGWNRPNPSFRDLRIMNATWGRGRQSANVTNLLNSMIRAGKLYFKVNNTNLGGDPAPGLVKELNVYYLYQGRHWQRKWREGDTVALP